MSYTHHPTISNADLIIEARWIATVNPQQPLLEQHALVIQAGIIVAILPVAEARQQYEANSTICLDDHVLIPGLINLHSHAAMNLMRGIADDLPLMILSLKAFGNSRLY